MKNISMPKIEFVMEHKLSLLRVYKETLEALGNPREIFLLISSKGELLVKAVRPEVPERRRIRVNIDELINKTYFETTCGFFISLIIDMMEITNAGTYSLNGSYNGELDAVVFNLYKRMKLIKIEGGIIKRLKEKA